MAIQSSGAISLQDIQNEFGGSHPISLSEYYGVASGIPSSGQISVSQFYGASGITTQRSYTYTGSNYGSATFHIMWYDMWIEQEGYSTHWNGTVVCAGGDWTPSGVAAMTYNAWTYTEVANNTIRIKNNVPFPQHSGTIGGWRYFSKRLDPYQGQSHDDFGGEYSFYANRTTSSSYVTP